MTPPLLTAAVIVIGLRGATILALALCALTPGELGRRAFRVLELVTSPRRRDRA